MIVKRIAPALALLAVLVAGMGMSTVAMGDPSLPDVPKHRHFVVNGSGGLSEVGPRVCDNPALQSAFNQFHFNGHVGSRGLNNDQGGEIVRGNC